MPSTGESTKDCYARELQDLVNEIDTQKRQLKTKREECIHLSNELKQVDEQIDTIYKKIVLLEEKKRAAETQEMARKLNSKSMVSPTLRNVLIVIASLLLIRFLIVFE